jgi:hypothetical protein
VTEKSRYLYWLLLSSRPHKGLRWGLLDLLKDLLKLWQKTVEPLSSTFASIAMRWLVLAEMTASTIRTGPTMGTNDSVGTVQQMIAAFAWAVRCGAWQQKRAGRPSVPLRLVQIRRGYELGIKVAQSPRVVDEQGDERRGAQQESPADREAKKNAADKQDLGKPSEGRDEPPAETVEEGKRSPKSPWMGGG